MTQSKEQQLIEKITTAKKALITFREQRKLEIGQLAYQTGIAELNNNILKQAFLTLAETHAKQNHAS